MKRIVPLIVFLASLLLPAGAQIQNPVTFTTAQQRVGDKAVEIVFRGTVSPGWHVYGTDIASGGPTCAELTMETCEGAKPDGKLQMRGKVHRAMDELFGMEVSYMEGTATFVQRFTLTAPTYKLSGYLTYGACNATNCMPPADVEFTFEGEGPTAKPSAAGQGSVQGVAKSKPSAQPAPQPVQPDTTSATLPLISDADTTAEKAAQSLQEVAPSSLWEPVVDELKAFGETAQPTSLSLWRILLMGFLGGLIALLTPCVWPIIPMTVSFFLKRASSRSRGIRDAVTYGLSIVVIYLGLGLLVTLIFGASALNALSTNAFFNILFFLLLVLFGASFLGGFELTLPSRWTNAVDRKSERTAGLLSIFLMAFTLSLVSFSCTGPIIGFLLVELGTVGNIVAPAVGMLGFALALALPFTLFAMFPAWLKSVPRSGNWMNVIKVSLGFLELAFSLKFLSVADLAYGWHLLDREVFLALWIVLFALLGAYLIGWIRFPHDEDEYDEMGNVVQRPRTGVVRFFLATLSLAFALYMVPGLWGAPCKAVSAFAPPMQTQDFNLLSTEVKARFHDYDEGMAYARAHDMPVMLDFTGYGCVNCRKMEAAVWTDPRVANIINNRYVLVTLYVDEKTPLPQPLVVEENGQQAKLRTVGDRWSYLQRVKFGANAQPFYVLIDKDGHPLNHSYSYDEDIPAYLDFLNQGLRNLGK
ncbi:MAG: thioredoxin family protein [Bacteroidaceae bacterium]|nr:thioredoxin family protein [Bacteroidaceae bacterium]